MGRALTAVAVIRLPLEPGDMARALHSLLHGVLLRLGEGYDQEMEWAQVGRSPLGSCIKLLRRRRLGGWCVSVLAVLLWSLAGLGSEVINIEELLRKCWSRNTFLSQQGHDGVRSKPFLVEESSKAHIERICEVLSSNSDWAAIAMIAHISHDAERLGRWAEGCPCSLLHDGGPCSLKGCRAPEMATGKGMTEQWTIMQTGGKLFPAYLAHAPPESQPALSAAWTTARSRLLGSLAGLSRSWSFA